MALPGGITANPDGTYTDQSGSQVFYTPPILSTGDENGYGGGEIQIPERWTKQGAQTGYDEDGNPSYSYSPYVDYNSLGLPSMGGIGDIGIAGPNTGTITMPDGAKQVVNYYVGGSNVGEYNPKGESYSSQGNRNQIRPTGLGFVGDNQPAYITPIDNKPVFTPPPKDTSTGALNLGAAFNELNSDGALTAIAATLGAEALPGLMGAGEAGAVGAAGSAGTAGSGLALNNSIYQPAMQALMDAGVPWQVVQAMPSVVNSSLQGGALSSLTGGSFEKGAGMGAIGSVLGNFLQSQGFNVPTSLLSLATNAIGSGLGLLGGGSSASGGQTGTNGTYGTPSGNTAGNAPGTTINQQGSGVLPFAPPTNVVAAGKQVTPPPEFGGISAQLANIAPYQSRPMSPLEDYKDTPFQEYAPIEQTANTAAHGGLMHFAEGGDIDKSIAELNARIAKILAPETKEASQDDQIKDYLSRQALLGSKQEFISPLSAKMMRGRGVKAPSFSGLQESALSAAPRMASTLAGMNPLQNTASFIPQARIPFAAHGGQIHPDLARVLEGRNVEMEGEYVPGPEGRLYAKHDIRGFAVGGAGTGQSDDIPTMLSDSEYVIDADTVAALGDGSSKAGAEALDKMRMAIRKHKRSASISDIPPKAKSPFKYIEDGRKMNVKTK
jgi:hypothetical protein